MFKKSWAKSLVAGAAALLSSSALLAAPVTVGFEGAFDLLDQSNAHVEQGLSVSMAKETALIDVCTPGFGYGCPTGNASVQLQAFNNPVVSLGAVGGFYFGLNGLDAAFVTNDVVDFSGLDLRLSITGQTEGGGTLNRLLSLVESTSTPNEFEFASYSFDSSWTRLSSVSISACLFDGIACVNDDGALSQYGLISNDLQFALDNITVAIPEPSAAWLVALSLGALVATRRRNAR